MSWPDPGTEHGDATEPAPGADDERDDTPPGSDTDVDEGTPAYARLRSEAEDDLGRWETAEDASIPEDDPDGRGVPRGAPGGPEWSDDDATDGRRHHVRTDDPGEVTPGDDGGHAAAAGVPPGSDEVGPAPTVEDDHSDALTGDEALGLGGAAFSPHTGSWDPSSGAGETSSSGPGRARSYDGRSGGVPQEGVPEAVEPDAPGGIAGPDGPPRAVGGPTFHGEHGDGGPSDQGPFHGERSLSDADPGGPDRSARSPSAVVIEDALAGWEDADRHATVMCVANQKGGVGKTTTAVSLGAALAMLGAQVLVVDLDPQGNATTGLGLRAQEGAPSTYRVIVEQMDVEDAAEPTAVRGLHVLPSSLDLAGAEIELVPAFSRENRLRNALDAVRDLYDVILIDCPPSLGLLTINALVAADQVLVPIQCEYYALEGLGQLMRTVKLVADSLNRGLEVGGVVLTMFDGRTNLSQQVVEEVRNYFGDVAYRTIVPRTVRLSEAPSYGQPIGVFDATSRGARAYERLAREVARRLDLELETEEVAPLDRLLGSSPAPPEEAAPLPTDLAPEDVPAVNRTDQEDHEGLAPERSDGHRVRQDEPPLEAAHHGGHGDEHDHGAAEDEHHVHHHDGHHGPGTEGWS